ncbi:MAG: MBL fold metallo-hydrolase [Acidobacteria bacterium]|jgi:ribonuclease Z|nr:MBL fold metallo-hydrolase [Acidobacteriota bacterium]
MALRRLELPTSWGPLLLVGGSRAGEGTLVLLPQLRLALDAGRPHRALPPMSTVFVSHGHLDHIGAVAYWASQRFLGAMQHGVLLAPAAIAGDIQGLLELHATLEGGRPYDVEVVPVTGGGTYTLRKDIRLTFFATDHWVPTLGASLAWHKHRLRPELVGMPEEEIVRLRMAGEEVDQELVLQLLSYTADTGPGIFTTHPEAFEAEVVLLECSFWRPADRDRAREFGHLHLDDLTAIAPLLKCRHLVVLHPSRRHRLGEADRVVRERIGPMIRGEAHSLAIDWE